MRSRNFAMAPISIHALCEEGDLPTSIMRDMKDYFYPRPLRGGRHFNVDTFVENLLFLSTPSARRATLDSWHYGDNYTISIHALCEEGDQQPKHWHRRRRKFLSTPSARRATTKSRGSAQSAQISIHALCEEGDARPHYHMILYG